MNIPGFIAALPVENGPRLWNFKTSTYEPDSELDEIVPLARQTRPGTGLTGIPYIACYLLCQSQCPPGVPCDEFCDHVCGTVLGATAH